MANFNKVILAGNLTRDPQLSYTPSQTAVCEFGMAVNRRYRGSDGQQREDTCFVDCQAWGKTGEIINQYMSKGRPILVDGRLTYDSWEGQDGKKRSRLRVTVENFQFLGSGGGGGGGGGGQGGGGYQQQQQRRPAPPAPQPQGGGYSAPPQPSHDDAPPPQQGGDYSAPPQPSYEDAPEPIPPDIDAPGGDNIPF